jgi:hypothetical protein
MAKRYKLSEEKINEFWGWFGKKKPTSLQNVINTDPVLKKLDNDMEKIGKSYIPYLKKAKQKDPETWKKLVASGLISDKDLEV